MTAVAVLAVICVAAGAASVAMFAVPPTKRLAPRVRPYAGVARNALGHHERTDDATLASQSGGALAQLFGPPMLALVARVSRSAEQRGNEQLARLLHQAGEADRTPDEQRVRQLGEALGIAVAGGAAVAVLLRTPVAVLVAAVAGFVVA